MSTSFDIVRNEQIAAIRALTPTSLAGSPFVASLGEHDFRTWAQATGKDALRRFDIEDVFSDSTPDVYDGVRAYTPRMVEILVSYPLDYRYGSQNMRSLDRAMREDVNLIAATVNGTAIYTDAAAIFQSIRIDSYEAVQIAVISFALHFTEVTTAQVSAMQNSTHQAFRVSTTASSDTLAVAIPLVMTDATYVVQAQVISTTYGGVGATPIDSTKTATGFTLQFDATLPIGVTIDIEVEDR